MRPPQNGLVQVGLSEVISALAPMLGTTLGLLWDLLLRDGVPIASHSAC